jgi:DNA-binding NarL/FixJ family response regulator
VLRGLSGDYDIITTSNSAEVLAQMELRPVPLVITDYHMAGMNGLQLTAAIKERAPETCVVLITAFASPELQKRARAQQVDYYLPKPFALETLEQIVRATLA